MNPSSLFPSSTPEAQGVASSAILAFINAAEQRQLTLHSLMLLRRGHLLAAGWWRPFAPELPHMLFSLSKSFTSTAIGLAVAEGRLTVDDRVLDFFPEDMPETVNEHLAAMRVRHLLSMSTGHTVDTTGALRQQADGNWVRAFLAQPVERTPGTHFVYNSGATYMLSAILQKLTGVTLLEYLRPCLFEPLGIENPTWESCPRGINVGGWGLMITTEGIARFGQLYLQQGQWQGQQIIPTAWVAEATAKHVANGTDPASDWAQGYGYQFWRCRHNVYRGDGAFGQYCVIFPEQEAVLAITSAVGNMQAVLDLVWEHLLSAMHQGALPPDEPNQRALEQKLANLAIPPLTGRPQSPIADRVSGQTYHFATNDQGVATLALNFDAEGSTLTISDPRGQHRICAGAGAWRQGSTNFESPTTRLVVASGAWVNEATYKMQLCYYTTPFQPTLTFRFDGDTVTYQYQSNVAFGPLERPALTGRWA